MKPESYREPSKKRCENCKYVFCYKSYDREDEFFCMVNDIDKRPSCGSCLMNESFFLDDGEHGKPGTFEKNMNVWDAWSEPRGVCAFGCCDEFEAEEFETKE
jgi:hypothetical protein